MEVTFFQALLIGVLSWLGHSALLGYAMGGTMWSPIIFGLPIGIILGDIPTAMMVAAFVQLPYLGVTNAGLALPSDPILAGTVGTSLAILTGVSPQAAVTLAVPIGLLGLFLHQIRMGTNAIWQQRADRYAEKGEINKLVFAHVVIPQAVLFLLYGVTAFLAVYYGNTMVQGILDTIPSSIMHGLEVIGGMMPAIGIALTIRVIGKNSILPYFFIGFLLSQYFGLSVFPVAVLALCIAILHLELKGGDQKWEKAN